MPLFTIKKEDSDKTDSREDFNENRIPQKNTKLKMVRRLEKEYLKNYKKWQIQTRNKNEESYE